MISHEKLTGPPGVLLKRFVDIIVSFVFVMLIVLIHSTVNADPNDQFKEGIDAYHRQDYAAALRLLKPLADKGNRIAQCLLGDILYGGLGVPQNDVEAAKW